LKFENRYTWADRVLHKVAFRSGGIQVALADIEEQLYKSRLAGLAADRPVFVTALPRAGTTILLNLLVETGSFASHTYRDMPFVLCPMIWQALTKPFQTHEALRERAHGDGLMVASDSPEAFEEMVWRQFWPAHYRDSYIEPWEACDDVEFLDFFRSHVKKIVALRAENGSTLRYLSKNNLNISRLACLPKAFPDAKVIVLFREPLQHASSLLKQHRTFLEAHRDDAFAGAYMAGIGHYDFGANLRPVNFDGWLDRDRRPDALELGFWLEYWIAAYRNIMRNAGDRVRLFAYGRLTSNPHAGLEWIASFLELDDASRLSERATQIRASREHEVDTSTGDKRLIDEARDLHSQLLKLSEF
jgi:hypothetical protein